MDLRLGCSETERYTRERSCIFLVGRCCARSMRARFSVWLPQMSGAQPKSERPTANAGSFFGRWSLHPLSVRSFADPANRRITRRKCCHSFAPRVVSRQPALASWHVPFTSFFAAPCAHNLPVATRDHNTHALRCTRCWLSETMWGGAERVVLCTGVRSSANAVGTLVSLQPAPAPVLPVLRTDTRSRGQQCSF
jgi:hypothetical protein